jgi:hypothetical protein
MSYDFTLMIHGLIFMDFKGSDKLKPTAIDAVLLDTRSKDLKHLPYLNFSLADRASGSDMPYQLVPGPDGMQFGRVDLEGRIVIEAETGAPSLTALWNPGSPKESPSSSEEGWLDWVPSLTQANDGTKDPLAVIGNSVIARVQLSNGELSACDIVKDRSTGDPLLWQFKGPRPQDPCKLKQALANCMALCIRGLQQPIWIKSAKGALGLIPPGSGTEVMASLTHLPDHEPEPCERLMHFAMYYDLVEWSSPRPTDDDLNLPQPDGLLDTSEGSICTGGRR